MPRKAPASLVDEDLGIEELLDPVRGGISAIDESHTRLPLPETTIALNEGDVRLVALFFVVVALAAGAAYFLRWRRRNKVRARVGDALAKAAALEEKLLVGESRTWSDHDSSPEEDRRVAAKMGKALSAAVAVLQDDVLVHDAWTAAATEIGDSLSTDLERASCLRDSLSSAARFLAALRSFWAAAGVGHHLEAAKKVEDEIAAEGDGPSSHSFLALAAAYRELPRYLRFGREQAKDRCGGGAATAEEKEEVDAIASGSPPPSPPAPRFRKDRYAERQQASRTGEYGERGTVLSRMYERALSGVNDDWTALEISASSGFRGGDHLTISEAEVEAKQSWGARGSVPSSCLSRYRRRLVAIANIGDSPVGGGEGCVGSGGEGERVEGGSARLALTSPERRKFLTKVKTEPERRGKSTKGKEGVGGGHGFGYGDQDDNDNSEDGAEGVETGSEAAAGHTPSRLLRAEVDAAVASLGVSRHDAALEVLRADLNHRSRASVSMAAAAAAAAVARRSDEALVAAAREMCNAFWARAEAGAALAARKRSRRRRRRRRRKAVVLAAMRRRAWGRWFRAIQFISVCVALALSLTLIFATGGSGGGGGGEFWASWFLSSSSSSSSSSASSAAPGWWRSAHPRATLSSSSWMSPIADTIASLRVAVLTAAAIVATAAAGHVLGRGAAMSVTAAALAAAHAAELTAAARRSWALLGLFVAHEAAAFLLLHSDLLGAEERERSRRRRRQRPSRRKGERSVSESSSFTFTASPFGIGAAATGAKATSDFNDNDVIDFERDSDSGSDSEPLHFTSPATTHSVESTALAIMIVYVGSSAVLSVLSAAFVGCGAARGGECVGALAGSARTAVSFFHFT